MNESPLLKILPIIVIAVVLAGGLIIFQQRSAMQARLKELMAKAQTEATTKLPEPTPTVVAKFRDETIPSVASPTVVLSKVEGTKGGSVTVTPSVTISITPSIKKSDKNLKTGVTTITKNTVCSPVYGMANPCAEHVVVDTGVDTSAMFNLAGLSYLGGLLAFIVAKRA